MFPLIMPWLNNYPILIYPFFILFFYLFIGMITCVSVFSKVSPCWRGTSCCFHISNGAGHSWSEKHNSHYSHSHQLPFLTMLLIWKSSRRNFDKNLLPVKMCERGLWVGSQWGNVYIGTSGTCQLQHQIGNLNNSY